MKRDHEICTFTPTKINYLNTHMTRGKPEVHLTLVDTCVEEVTGPWFGTTPHATCSQRNIQVLQKINVCSFILHYSNV